MRRAEKLLSVGLLVGLCLVGCGEDASNEGGNLEGGSDNGDKITLELWMDSDEYATQLEEAIESEFENVDIVYEKVLNGEAADKLALDGPAGIGGDIVFQTQESMAKAFQSNVLLPLGDELTAYVENNMIEASFNAVRSNDVM